MKRTRPAAVCLNDFIDFGHQADGFVQGDDHALVVGNVIAGERAALAVFQPFFADLITADVEVPYGFRYALETLGGVDPDSAILPDWLLWDAVVTIADKAGDEGVDLRRFQQV